MRFVISFQWPSYCVHTVWYWILGFEGLIYEIQALFNREIMSEIMSEWTALVFQLLLSLISTLWYLSSDSIAIRILTHKMNVCMCPKGGGAGRMCHFLWHSGVMCTGKAKLVIYSKAHLPLLMDFVCRAFHRVPKEGWDKRWNTRFRHQWLRTVLVDILCFKLTCALSWTPSVLFEMPRCTYSIVRGRGLIPSPRVTEHLRSRSHIWFSLISWKTRGRIVS